jgi:DinB superfamily
MSRAAIEQYLYLMDEAFDVPGSHPLLSNLRSVGDGEWQVIPEAGGRSIFDIIQHVGECKYVYDNHAFGDASMMWGQLGTIPAIEPEAKSAEIIAWLEAGHARLRGHVAELADDSELLRLRSANWGKKYETRWLINAMIQHDLYHGGEVNHLRALLQHTDRWAYDP